MSMDDFSRNIPRRNLVIVIPITPIHPLPQHRNGSVVTGSIVQLYIYCTDFPYAVTSFEIVEVLNFFSFEIGPLLYFFNHCFIMTCDFK